jgi:hypothetical protein
VDGLVDLPAAKTRPLLVLHDLGHLDLAVRQRAPRRGQSTRSAGTVGQSRLRLVTQPANTRASTV